MVCLLGGGGGGGGGGVGCTMDVNGVAMKRGPSSEQLLNRVRAVSTCSIATVVSLRFRSRRKVSSGSVEPNSLAASRLR